MSSARLSRTTVLPAAAALTAALLAGCGAATNATGAATASPSASVVSGGAGMSSTGAMGAAGSPSAMASGMAVASPDATGTTATGTTAPGSPAAGAHNAADVAFVMGMIPHHAQAVAMADLAATRAGSPQVKALAVAIKAAQAPEITEMSGWARGWSMAVPTEDMSGMAMTGMMSAADMASLAKLTGTPFDRAWLTMMTSHHHGALAMARTELTTGTNPQAKTLARSIITSQTAQITQMKTILASLPTG